MKLARFTLRTLFVAVAIGSIALGWFVDRVHREDAFVRALGGEANANKVCIYDFQMEYAARSGSAMGPAPTEFHWLSQYMGRSSCHSVGAVLFGLYPEDHVSQSTVDAMCRLPSLQKVRFSGRLNRAQIKQFRLAQPNVEILDSPDMLDEP